MGREARRRTPTVKALESRPWTAESRALSEDFPENAANCAAIREVLAAKAELIQRALADGWAESKTGWKKISGDCVRTGEISSLRGFFDSSIRSSDLINDELEATLESYGGRGHGKTVARLMSVGAQRAAGVDAHSFSGPRDIEERVYRAPRGALDPSSEGQGREKRGKAGRNPLALRAGGSLRPTLAPVRTGVHARSESKGASSPLSRLVKMPTSPLSPVRDASPLPRSTGGSFKGVLPRSDGFAKSRPTAVSNLRQQQTDSMITSMLGPATNASTFASGTKFGEPVTKHHGKNRSVSSLSDRSSDRSLPETRPKDPLSPLLAARTLTSPHLLPIAGRGGKRASAHKIVATGNMHHTWTKEEEDPNVYAGAQKQGWHEQVMRLRSVVADGSRANWKMTSPLTDLERIILAQSKWRQKDAVLDTHDKVVLAGMPYSADKIIANPGALRALGQAVLNPDPLIRTAGLAALGDRNNYGNPSCLAQVVPRLADPDTRVKASALRGIEQIAKPGEEKQYMEVEIEVFGANNLPKKDRFGACDGYVILTLKHPGQADVEVGRTAIKWKDLNPRWRQNFYFEIKEPTADVIEFSVWDEDGETDDICGVCSLPVNEIEFVEETGAKPQMSRTLQILDQESQDPVRGWNSVSLQNNGEPSKLQIKARYTAYLRPKDLINQFIQMLQDDHPPTRSAALDTVSSFCTDGNVLILEAVANMLEDNEASIRSQAALRLEELAGVNDPDVIRLAARRMDHCDPRVRHIAVETLRKVSTKGNTFTIAQVAKRLESHVSLIRSLVSEAMPVVADEGDPSALKEILARFRHHRSEVREAAIRVFTTITQTGDQDMISAIEPMMEDDDQGCRMAAVQALYRICNVGPLGDAAVLARGRIILQKRIDFNNGAGDPNRVILDSVKKALATLNQKAPWIFGCDPAKEGEYNALLPAYSVRITRDQGVFTELVDPMPIDTKFHSSLPYRPPTPPWEEKAMQKASLHKTIAKAKEDLAIVVNVMAQLEEEAEERELSTGEQFELEECAKKEAQFTAILQKAEEELKELIGDVEVQPPNTTKLGFIVSKKTGYGEHCQWHKCERSACF